jgi:hypothetical protein
MGAAALVLLCDPETWPCYPLLAIRHKDNGRSATLLHIDGQPRHVIHASCSDVRSALNRDEDPTTIFSGSAEFTCADVEIDWQVDPDQSGCC